MTGSHLIESRRIAEIRRADRRSRLQTMYRYRINGGRRKQRECAICGEAGPSWCGEYPQTKAAAAWEADHRREHVIG